MPEAERHSIAELITRYELETTLRDIYVEGPEDKVILDGILEEQEITGVSIFDISCVDVPAIPGEENNNRSRLIQLSQEFITHFTNTPLQVTCLIDSDFDYLNGNLLSNAFLITTDYANMEMYFFTSDIIGKLNQRCLIREKICNQTINNFLIPLLKILFLIRYVNTKPYWHLENYDFEKLISYNKSKFHFELDDYIRRYLNKNGRLSDYKQFKTEIKDVKIPDCKDHRCFIHGHDFLTVLRKILNCLVRKKRFQDNEILFDVLKTSADYKVLANERMFSEIIRRFA